MTDHLVLVDCSGFAYRAYYSMPALRREADGSPTGAVLGFMAMCWRLLGALQADPATHIAAVFDAPGANFRHRLFPDYKGGRPPARRLELKDQLLVMRPVAEVLGMKPVEIKGFEADDVLATLAARAMKAGIRTSLVSSDKDMAQLVVDGWIEIVDPMAHRFGKSPRKLQRDVVEKFGVEPKLVPDVQALAGDTADSIPGVPGIGLSKAAELVRRFGGVEAVLKHRKEIRNARIRVLLERHQKDVRLYLKLTTLRRNVPIRVSWDALKIRPIFKADLERVVKSINPAANIQQIFGLDLQNERPVEKLEEDGDPFEWWREELKAPGQPLPEMPQCGFYKTRLVRGGPMVGARIYREPETDALGHPTGREVLKAEINGRPRDPNSVFAGWARNPIPESEYRFLTADAAHARLYRPNDPVADPSVPIDLTKQAAPRNPRAKERS